jgi:hypothetical protein
VAGEARVRGDLRIHQGSLGTQGELVRVVGSWAARHGEHRLYSRERGIRLAEAPEACRATRRAVQGVAGVRRALGLLLVHLGIGVADPYAEKTTLPRAPADVSDSFRVATSGTRA